MVEPVPGEVRSLPRKMRCLERPLGDVWVQYLNKSKKSEISSKKPTLSRVKTFGKLLRW